MIFMIADPTITPSETAAMAAACSGPEIPKPTAQGRSLACLAVRTMAPTSVVIELLVPVTPREETQYKKPEASFAIMVILSLEVGAIIEIRSLSYFLQIPSNSSFSS